MHSIIIYIIMSMLLQLVAPIILVMAPGYRSPKCKSLRMFKGKKRAISNESDVSNTQIHFCVGSIPSIRGKTQHPR